MSIYKIIALAFLIASLLRIAYIIWHYLIKRKQVTPTIAKIIWSSDPVMETFAYKRPRNRAKTLIPPYISYYINNKTYASDSSKAKDIIKSEQKKQNDTGYMIIYIDKNNPEEYSYYSQPDYRLSLLYALSASMIITILFIVLP